MNERASRSLAAYFPAQDEAATHEDQSHYSDSDVMEISNLLKQTRGTWSRVPRLYIVLRIIGQLHRLDDFIDLGFTDYWFPLKSKSLPDFLGPTDKANFVHAQSLVLTQASDLENGEIGRHRNFDSKESIPFESRGDLGHGAFGGVDKVVSLVSRKIYARKLIYRRALFPFPRAAQTMAAYVSELEILKRLKHRHAVELVGSYTDQSTLGLIMTPVADCNLAEYIMLAGSPDAVNRKSHLRNFFGCLTTALEYLHDSKIRHKDIKPQNILIKRHNVLLTDFGLARDLVDASGGTTEGATPLTPKYCAPEVGNYEPRNYSSDIWSLGCVFLEMVTIIKGESLAAQNTFFENNGTKKTYFRLNVEAIKRWTTKLEMQGLFSDNVPIDWISRMLSENRNDRPTAQALLRDILNYRPTRDSVSSFCGTCCKTSDEAMEDVEYDEQSLFVSDEQSLFVSQTASSTAVESSATGSRAPAPQDVDMPDGIIHSQRLECWKF
jgi:serine/threonine protein kinase